jgi:uncharacterized protein (TIGR02217 family)
MSFHDVRFPTGISRHATGGPERRTDVVVLASGHEERNSRWADSRRSYNAGYGVRSLDDIHTVIAFFEERRGRLHGFRWRDHVDWKSCSPSLSPSATDEELGVGDGLTAEYQLVKGYGSAHAPWTRDIKKPVAGSVLVAVGGVAQPEGAAWELDAATGVVTFQPGSVPAPGEVVTAGFAFDVPVRFDTDRLEINVHSFRHGAIPNIPLVEIRA